MWKAVSNARTIISADFANQIISYQSTSKQPSHFAKKLNAKLITAKTVSKQTFVLNVRMVISFLQWEHVNKDQEM